MQLYEYIRSNYDVVRTLIRSGMMSPKYLVWYDMYEYVNARTRMRKRGRRSSAEIMREASDVFNTSEKTIFRACAAMKQPTSTTNGKHKT